MRDTMMLRDWRLADFEPGEGQSAGIFKESLDDSEWMEITAPGDVHGTLVEAGRLPDPFYGRNELDCQWVEEREWWYRATFEGPETLQEAGTRLRIVFHGMDTFATIWVNGREIGSHANMFREASYDVTEAVKLGATNTVAVRFDPPIHRVENAELGEWAVNEPARTAMRKAQYGFGWDWGPRLPTVGLWRAVELRTERIASLKGIHFRTLEIEPDNSKAVVAVTVEIEHFAGERSLEARLSLAYDDTVEIETTVGSERLSRSEEGYLCGTAYLEVANPRLWWTHDLGPAELYDLSVALYETGADGAALDTGHRRVGIRTVELDQSPDPDEPGTRFFRFVLNGVPIFSRGANWIPADSFVGSLDDERYKTLIEAARDANMNMLRVWGGGLYEHDTFYELCDARGLLVWQDFMFACAAYPENSELAREIEEEARYQVRRLRTHPSLALWCGNNENQEIHENKFWRTPDYKVPGSLYYDEVLPQVVAELDGSLPYWPGSPFGGNDHNSMQDGDRHDWEVWHGKVARRFGEEPYKESSPEMVSYLRYAEDTGRFISEFGMHAAPVYETLRRNIPPEELYYHSPAMDHHNKDTPKNKGDNLMQGVTGLPETLEEYIDFSQISQAEGLKFALEHFRRRKPHCSGTLIWQLNDCWPVLSWSIIDYYGFGKAGYYYTSRAYAPVLASLKQLENGSVELWITNDTLEPVQETAEISLSTFAGHSLFTDTVQLDIAANSSRVAKHWRAEEIQGGNDRYLSVRAFDSSFPDNRLFFCPIKDLDRQPVEPEIEVEQNGNHRLRVKLEAESFAYFVHLAVGNSEAHFSDNYIDLEPAISREIIVEDQTNLLRPEMLRLSYR